MTAAARLSQMPDWPLRMTAEIAAMYLGISQGSFLDRVGKGMLPAGVREGGNVLWSRPQLDRHVAKQFGLPQGRAPAAEVDTWADLGRK